jgi:hypothetical protein
MRTNTHSQARADAATSSDDLEDVTGYEDGDSYVVCEKSNPNAWIRADVTTTLSP